MASESKITTNHDEIRQWVENRGGQPARVKGTGSSDDAGLLRIDYPGYGEDENLEKLSWDDFFEKFEREQLAFLYQESISSGEESRFSKLVSRDTVQQASRH